MGEGLLFSQMEPAPADELAFHQWYDAEHIPPRMALRGFDSAYRYVAPDGGPWHLACYFLSDMAALDTPEYQALKADPGPRSRHMLGNVTAFTRYLCDLLSDTGPTDEPHSRLFVTAFAVPEAAAEAFDSWYQEEHVPLLMKADGWLRVRRYAVRPGSEGPAWTRLALHELRAPSALASPEREAARATPWRARLAGEPWFSENDRWIYRPIASATATWR